MATGTKVENFYAQFGADFKELLSEFKKAERETGKFRSTMSRDLNAAQAAIDKFGASVKGAMLGLVGGLTLGKLTQMTRQTLEWADSTKTLADRLGTSAESIQELTFAGREVNITAQEMTKGLSEFAVKVAEAGSGKGRGVVAFQELGISLRGVGGEVKNLDQLLDEFANKIQQFDRPSQLALAKSFFGDEGALKFLDLLGQGKVKIDDLRKAAREAGVVLSNELIARGEELNKKVELLTDQVSSSLRQAFLELGPVIEGSLKVLLSFLRETKEFVAWLKGQNPDAFKGRWAIQPAPPPGAKSFMDLRTGARVTQIPLTPEFEEGRPLHDETVTDRNELARRERTAQVGTRVANLSGAGASQAETFRKLMEDLRTKTEQATAALDPYRAAIADLDGKLLKLKATETQETIAHAEFKRAWDAAGTKALKEFGAESEQLAKLAAAEAAGRRDLVAVLELEFAMRQKFGAQFVETNKVQIEAAARQRFQIEEQARLQKEAMAELEGIAREVATTMLGNFGEFFEKGKNGWDVLRDRALSALNMIQNKLAELALNDFMRLLGFDTKGPGLGGIGGLLGGLLGIGGGDAAAAGATAAGFIPAFAEGGRPSVGMPSLVGEKGPELFVPDTAGTIVPNSRMGGVTYIDARGADQSALARLEQIVRSQGREMRHWQASERPRVLGHVSDGKRRGGSFADTMGG